MIVVKFYSRSVVKTIRGLHKDMHTTDDSEVLYTNRGPIYMVGPTHYRMCSLPIECVLLL